MFGIKSVSNQGKVKHITATKGQYYCDNAVENGKGKWVGWKERRRQESPYLQKRIMENGDIRVKQVREKKRNCSVLH